MKGLEGKVALIADGGNDIGRAIALALSARGVRIMVVGPNEKALGETVGEVAYGGGKARHLAGDPRDEAVVSAAVDRALEVFGGALHLVIATVEDASCTFRVGGSRLASGGRMFFVAAKETAHDAKVTSLITTNVVIEPEEIAEMIVLLALAASSSMRGRTITVR